MKNNYETPELLFVAYSDSDIIATSNHGIDLPDVPLGRISEDEIM